MSEPTAAAGARREHNCQTPDCPNDYGVITLDVDTTEVTMLCHSCQLAFNLAVLQQMTEDGTLVLDGTPAQPVAPQATPG